MAITNFMNLDLPGVLVTLGPEWAEKINDALELVDEHDHTSGKGKKVPTAGIDINANLNFQNRKAFNLFSTQFQASPATLTGASNANSTFVFNNDLYFTNGAGVAVQITNGGSVVTVPGSVQTLEYFAVNSNLTINPASTFVFIAVDTTAGRTINLPLASSVATGRIYAIKDASGQSRANPITLNRQGADLIDGAASHLLDSEYGTTWVISDGVSNWYRL